jgi:hypothetical protein
MWDLPLSNPEQKGAHPSACNLLMYLFDKGGAEKVITFLIEFLIREPVFGA